MRLSVLLLCLICLLAAGCGQGPGSAAQPVVVQLADTIAAATFYPVLPMIDLRSDAAVAAAPALTLGSGWSSRERWGTWAVGTRSIVVARLLSARPCSLFFECRPYRRLPHEPVQAVTVTINGTPCGSLELEEQWQQYRLPLPDSVLRPGLNEIVLDHRYHHSSRELGRGEGSRRLANGYRRLGLIDPDPPGERSEPLLQLSPEDSVTLSGPGDLVIPLRLAGGPGRLALAALLETEDAAAPASLGASILTLDGEQRQIFATSAGSGAAGLPLLSEQSFDLPGEIRGWCFLVISARFAEGRARLTLQRPRLLLAGQSSQPVAASPRASSQSLPNIVVVILDAARADHFSCYGYRRATTPNIDRLARSSLVFRNVIAEASYTSCSLPTMLTGLPFSRHGMVEDNQQLAEERTTLAEYLRRRGYATSGITASPHHTRQQCLHQGYDELIETWQQTGSYSRQAMDPHFLTGLAVERLQRGFGKPFCLVLHYIPPHWPYTPPPRFDIFTDPGYQGIFDGTRDTLVAWQQGEVTAAAADRVRLRDLYDANLRRVDDAVGVLLRALQADEGWSETVVLVVADHGEAFWEHSLQGHATSVYEEMLRVPFILRLPPRLIPFAVDVERFASLADLVPTLLGLVGMQPAAGTSGVDLLAAGMAEPRWVVSRSGGRRPVYSVSTGRWKVMVSRDIPRLYDLHLDPSEQHDLAAVRPLLTTGLVKLLQETLARSVTASSAASVDEDEIEALQVLGYL